MLNGAGSTTNSVRANLQLLLELIPTLIPIPAPRPLIMLFAEHRVIGPNTRMKSFNYAQWIQRHSQRSRPLITVSILRLRAAKRMVLEPILDPATISPSLSMKHWQFVTHSMATDCARCRRHWIMLRSVVGASSIRLTIGWTPNATVHCRLQCRLQHTGS